VRTERRGLRIWNNGCAGTGKKINWKNRKERARQCTDYNEADEGTF